MRDGGAPPWRAPTILRVRWMNEHNVIVWAEIVTNRKHKKFWYSEGYEHDPGFNCNRDATTSLKKLNAWRDAMNAMAAAHPAPPRIP
jgi:hypothetical protein